MIILVLQNHTIMRKYIFKLALLLALFNISTGVFAQKTATSIITDVLRMRHSANAAGFEMRVVVPDLIQGADFIVLASDIREKNLNNLSTVKIKFFTNKPASSSNLASASSTFLSLSEPGLVVSGTVVSLGTLSFLMSNGTEVRISLPSNLSVLSPSSTVPGGVLSGKATCTVRTSNGTTQTFDRVIFFSAKDWVLPG